MIITLVKQIALELKRPIPKETLKSLKETINLEWTYNSNGIEGNTLTLKETQVVLEDITVGGKSIKKHLEAIIMSKPFYFQMIQLKLKIQLLNGIYLIRN